MTGIRVLFRDIRFFKPSEFDQPEMIDADALKLLDIMRREEGSHRKIIISINADYALTGHSANSRHAFGDAFDIVIRDRSSRRPLPILSQFFMAVRYTWGGIGIYPYWKDPGLHVDRRPWTVFGRRALWWRDREGRYHSIDNFLELRLEDLHE